MSKKKDFDLRQVMAEEGSRGKRHPVKSVTLERQRRIRKAIEMLMNKGCEKRDYLSGLRDLGLKDESPEFQKFEKVWDDYRRRS